MYIGGSGLLRAVAILMYLLMECTDFSHQDCSMPRPTPHSKFRMSKHERGGKYPEKTIWLLRCENGFVKRGSRVRRCVNGQWKGRPFSCISLSSKNMADLTKCRNPGVPPGAKRSRSKHCCKPGTTLRYQCKQGLIMQGPGRIKCLDNLNWSSRPPTCRRKRICVDPPPISHGYMDFKKAYPRLPGSGPGDAVIYRCDPGYHLVNHTYSHKVMCTENGRWTEQPDTCIKLYCKFPRPPMNGYIIAENKTYFESGEQIRYRCNERYELIDVRVRTCDDMSRGWDMWTPKCREIRCPNPGYPEFGRRVGANFSIGSVAKFHCFSGYRLVGSETRECLPTRLWSGTLTTCQSGQTYCVNPGIPVGGTKRGKRYNLGNIVKYTCNKGFYISGSAKRECLINRAWSGTPVVCEYERGRDDPKAAAQILRSDMDSLAMSSIDADTQYNTGDNSSSNLAAGRTLAVGHRSGLDLYFVFDVSGSINASDFKLAIDFASVLMDKIGMSKRIGGTRIGIVSFDTNVTVVLAPYDREAKDLLYAKEKLKLIKHTGGGTATAEALEQIYQNLIPTSIQNVGVMPQQAIILITDGVSNMAGNPTVVSDQLKDEPFKVDIYCVGLGASVDKKQLLDIASKSQVIVLESAETLHEVTEAFLDGEADYSECGIRWNGGLPWGNKLRDGWFASDIREWPWMVSLYYDKTQRGNEKTYQFFCGGTLIADQWILTAAHCFPPKRNNPKFLQVRLGQHDRNRVAIMVDVKYIYRHENYRLAGEEIENYQHDIALLQLVNPVNVNPKVRTVCLPSNISDDLLHDWYKPGWKQRYVLGWGSNETVKAGYRSRATDILKTISIPIAENATCRKSLWRGVGDMEKLFVDGMFCAGDGDGTDSCDRDSGGPFLIEVQDEKEGKNKVYQIGIVSWAQPGCRQKGQYGFYTRLSDYTDWIRDIMAD